MIIIKFFYIYGAKLKKNQKITIINYVIRFSIFYAGKITWFLINYILVKLPEWFYLVSKLEILKKYFFFLKVLSWNLLKLINNILNL
jgi:hypothetical protein